MISRWTRQEAKMNDMNRILLDMQDLHGAQLSVQQ